MSGWKVNAAGILAAIVVAFGASASGQTLSSEGQAPGTRPRLGQRLEIPWGGVVAGRRLGVTLNELGPAETKARNLAAQTALLVESVAEKGAAEKAGIKTGDVIVEIDGEAARSTAQVRRLVNETAAGHALSITLFRDGRKLAVSVVPDEISGGLDDLLPNELRRELQDRLPRGLPREFYYWNEPAPGGEQAPEATPRSRQDSRRWPQFEWTPGAQRLGLVVQELGPQLAAYFGVKQGVLVASVTAGSPAATAGLKAGDVITGIGGRNVASPTDLVQAVQAAPDGKETPVTVVRDKKPLTVSVKLASARERWHVQPDDPSTRLR